MTERPEAAAPLPSSSHRRYRAFVDDYRHARLEDIHRPDRPQTRRIRPFGGTGRRYLKQYLEWISPYRSAIAILLTLAVVSAGLQMIEPLFLRFIIDHVLLNDSLEDPARLTRLHLAGGAFLTVILLATLIGAFRDYRQRVLNIRLTLTLRRSLLGRLLHLPLPTLWEMKTGGILSRLTGDVETTTGLVQAAVISPSVSVIRLTIGLVALVIINWRLAVTALTVVPIVMTLSFLASRRIRPIYRVIRKDAEQLDGRVGETLAGIRIVRAFRREARELLEYMRARHTVVRKELFAHRREMVLWTSWSILLTAMNVVIVWYGGYLNIGDRASIGDIMAFQWYTFLLLNPASQIVNSFSQLQRSLAAMERVFDVLSMPADKPDRPDAEDAPRSVRDITFEAVTFEYSDGRAVVRDFDVVVPHGSMVALVGRSGAGKTTVTDLVARFHDPTSGRILLNGTDIRGFKLRTYRELLALVQQDVFLFDGSVRDNIAYGQRNASDAAIEAAARSANCHEFIEKLPHGYHTFIGERGVKLSAGQRQRLAIARAVLAAPQILILDEATSNLDTESEQLIQESLATLFAGRTTFVIAHRLSTIRRADLILLMEDGRIIERGSHEQLMAAGGRYREMVLRQMDPDQMSSVEVLR